MRLGTIREVASRAEHLQGEQREAENEVRGAEQQANAAARQHSALMSQLRSLPDGEDSAAARASLESQIAQAEAAWQSAQSDLAAAEARQEAVNREIASVTSDAQEYLRSVEGNIEAAQGAAGASNYGSAAISRLIDSFQQNKGLAERVLQMFNQAGGAGAAAALGGVAAGAGRTAAGPNGAARGIGGASAAGAASGSGASGTGGSGAMADSAGAPATQAPPIIYKGSGNPQSVLHSTSWIRQKVPGLQATQQQTHMFQENGQTFTRYDDPVGTGFRLNHNQGKAMPDFGGTCGMCSCQNVARLAGKDITEADVITISQLECLGSYERGEYASNGGTCASERQAILHHMGIESFLAYDISPDYIARQVESGRGVIVSVWADKWWPGETRHAGHAVTVTSVERDASGTPSAFWVCDSGSGQGSRRVPASLFRSFINEDGALKDTPINVTTNPIR